jgi:hypothetical protein
MFVYPFEGRPTTDEPSSDDKKAFVKQMDAKVIKAEEDAVKAVKAAKAAGFKKLGESKGLKLLVKDKDLFVSFYMKGICKNEGLPELDDVKAYLKKYDGDDLDAEDKEKKANIKNAVAALTDAKKEDVEAFNKLYKKMIEKAEAYGKAVKALDENIVATAKAVSEKDDATDEEKATAKWFAAPSVDRAAVAKPLKAFAKAQKTAQAEDNQ